MRASTLVTLAWVALASAGCGSGGAPRGDAPGPPPPDAPVLRLFVLTGQSNALGVTNGEEADATSGTDPADAHVAFFWDNVADAATSLGTSDGRFTTLQDQQGGFFPGSATHWGPEIEMARSLYRAGMRDFGVIKASRGGGGNTHWSKAAGGHMYAHLVATVRAAADDLTRQGTPFEIVGLLYLQGESDSAAEAGMADTRLSELIADLRADLPQAQAMQAFVGGIAASGPDRDTVRARQAALADADPTVHYFDTVDLRSSLHDGLHFDKAGKVTVGARFANVVMDAGCHTATYGSLVFIGDSITQGGLGYASYRYEVFRHLAHHGAGFTFVGSVTDALGFEDVSPVTPAFHGRGFDNVHDGHWGWRAFWINARIPLPASRRGSNVGEGTLLNWTGQAAPQEYALDTVGNLVPYPDPLAVGTGNTGTTYVPDTAVVMIGINDLAGGSPPAQVRDDIGTILDQLRAANPAVRVHLCTVLHTSQNNPTLQANVDTLNTLLLDLAAAKNAASSTSPVWIADPSSGFAPALFTHDAVHPNRRGEAHIGERVARSLGLLGDPLAFPPPDTELDRSAFRDVFEGHQIYDGVAFVNGWAEVNPEGTTEALVGDLTDLHRQHVNGGAAWMDGTLTGWNGWNHGSWTFEAGLRIGSAPNGFYLWLGTDSNLILIEIADDATRGYSGGFAAGHQNDDGAIHVFRVAHDAPNERYHVWRDGLRLTPPAGVAYDLGNDDWRLILGDWTGGSSGDLYDVVIDYVAFDPTGAYLPPGG